MKKSISLFILTAIYLPTMALTYCQDTPFGYGAKATGAGSASFTKVSTLSELKTALGKAGSNILITKSITIDKTIDITRNNITIVGATGVTLTNKTTDQGVFHFSKGSNYIIRNINFVGPSATSNQGGDLLCFEGAQTAWVDHCSFDDGADGNFDICKGADNITVTWCRFKYSTSTTHNFSNLVGSSSTDAATDGTFNVTYAYCWWDHGCEQRMVRSRNASFHFLNCYWNSSNATYYIGLENSDAYIEGCYFGGSLSGSKIMGQGNSWYKESANGFQFVNSYSEKTLPSEDNSRTVTKPSYTYPAALTYSEAKKAVTDTSCGAGATLTVTTDGKISSACDTGEIVYYTITLTSSPNGTITGVTNGNKVVSGSNITLTATPNSGYKFSGWSDGSTKNPYTITVYDNITIGATFKEKATVVSNLTWNFSDSKFDDYVAAWEENVTIDGLTLAAKSGKAVTIAEATQSYDDYDFTRCCKMGGSMAADSRYLSFAVKGACTIEVYVMSANATTDRVMNLCAGSNTNVLTTIDAPMGTLNKGVYSYSGGATTILLGSKNSGINIYAINLVYSTTTGVEEVTSSESGKSFNIFGQQVDASYKGIVIRNGKKYFQF